MKFRPGLPRKARDCPNIVCQQLCIDWITPSASWWPLLPTRNLARQGFEFIERKWNGLPSDLTGYTGGSIHPCHIFCWGINARKALSRTSMCLNVYSLQRIQKESVEEPKSQLQHTVGSRIQKGVLCYYTVIVRTWCFWAQSGESPIGTLNRTTHPPHTHMTW